MFERNTQSDDDDSLISINLDDVEANEHDCEKGKSQSSLNIKYEIERDWYEGFPSLLSQVVIGSIRDFTWGILTYRNLNLFPEKMPIFWGTTLTQAALSFPVTLGAIKLNVDFAKSQMFINNKRNWVKKQFIFAAASLTAMPVWNCAQFAGNWCGEKLGLDPASAGYFSGIFSGIAETLWQGAIVIPKLLNQEIELVEVACNSLGGAVWQWILQANLSAINVSNNTNITLSDIGTTELMVGAEIAGGVAMSTILMTLLAWKIKQCRASDDTPYIKISEELNNVEDNTYLDDNSLLQTEESIHNQVQVSKVSLFQPKASEKSSVIHSISQTFVHKT